MKFLKELSWEKTTDEFIEILDMIGSGKGEQYGQKCKNKLFV